MQQDLLFFISQVQEGKKYQAYPPEEYRRILDAMNIEGKFKNMILLDVGCGSGAFSSWLIKLGFKVIGVDICYDFIKTASVENKEGFFINANALSLPFKQNSFDLIFTAAFLHHIPQAIPRILKDFFYLLRPQGKIYFFEPYSRCFNSFLWYRILSIQRDRKERAINPYKLEKCLKEAGFTNFNWRKLKRIKHIYYQGKDKMRAKFIGLLRMFFNYSFIPNYFFVGSAEKK